MANKQNIPVALLQCNEGQIEGLPRNPRFIKDERFKALVKSLEQDPEMLDLRECIVYPHGKKFVVICNNMRLRAAKELGFETLPCKILRADTPIEKLKRYASKDNIPFGSWDYDILANEWGTEFLEDCGFDFGDFFDSEAEQKEVESIEKVEEDNFDEDMEPIVCRCKRGEVWQLGNHRVMCGDSTSAEDVEKLRGGVLADMVFTDPPYGVSYTEKNEYLNSLGTGQRLTKAIENDSKPPQEMYVFWVEAFKNIHCATNQRMAYYITAPQGGDLLLLLLQALRDSGFMLKHQLIWNKNNHVLGRCDYNYKHEPIIYGWKIGGTHSFVGGSKFKTSVWDINKPLKNDLHPTMKPIELVAACIEDNSVEGQIVLDLFGGSGTTLIACEQLNRKCLMMEYEPHYCDVILARWEKLTGQTAVKIAD